MRIVQICSVLILLNVKSLIATNRDSIVVKRIKELHFGVSALNPLSFGLMYKIQLKKNNFFKIGLVNVSGSFNKGKTNNSQNFETNSFGYNIGGQIGFEKRKQVNNKLNFYHGPQIGYEHEFNLSRVFNPSLTQNEQTYISLMRSGFIGYSIGLMHQFNSNFFIGADINPSVSYNIYSINNGLNPSSNYSNEAVNFNFNSNIARLNLIYRF